MSNPPQYQVMGGDGQEYGPVDARQIREWIKDQRLEPKSPVRPPGSKDWVFLGSLPEFAGAFRPPAAPPAKRRPLIWLVPVLLVILAGLIILALKKFNPH